MLQCKSSTSCPSALTILWQGPIELIKCFSYLLWCEKDAFLPNGTHRDRNVNNMSMKFGYLLPSSS